MRFLDKFALIALVVLAIVSKAISDADNPGRRPDPGQFAPPETVTKPPETATLPPEFRNAPTFTVEIDAQKQSSTGTAFSVGDGVWVTARHVTDGCDLIVLQTAPRKGWRVRQLAQESNADISVLRTNTGAPSLPVADPQLQRGQKGWSFGYPKGEPGDVYGQIIGRAKMRAHGRYSTLEPVIAWTQIRRVPDIGTDLGGISGGPWVDAQGRVIGVHVAGSPRRGRSFSTDPSTLLAALSRAGIGASDRPALQLDDRDFARSGDVLRNRLTVAKVLCLVGDKWKRRARRS